MFFFLLSCFIASEVVKEYTKASRIDGGLFSWPNALTLWKGVLNNQKIFWDSSSSDVIKTDNIDYREVIKKVVTNFTSGQFNVNKMICDMLSEMNMTKEKCPGEPTNDAQVWTEAANDKYFLSMIGMGDFAIPGYTLTETDQLLSQVFAYAALIIPFIVFFVICLFYYIFYCCSCLCCCQCCCCRAKDRRKPHIVLMVLMCLSTGLIFVSSMFYMASVGKAEDTIMYIRNLPDNLGIFMDQIVYGAEKLNSNGIGEIKKTFLNATGSVVNFIKAFSAPPKDLAAHLTNIINTDITGTTNSVYASIKTLNTHLADARKIYTDQSQKPPSSLKDVQTSQFDGYVNDVKSGIDQIKSISDQLDSVVDMITDIETTLTEQLDNISKEIQTDKLKQTLDDNVINEVKKFWEDNDVPVLIDKIWATSKAFYIFPGFIILVLAVQFTWSFFTSCCCSRCTACCAPCCPCICNCSCMFCGILYTLMAFLILLIAEIFFIVCEYSIGDAYNIAFPEPIHIPTIDVNDMLSGMIEGVTVGTISIQDIKIAPETLPLATNFFDASFDIGLIDLFLLNKIIPLSALQAPLDNSIGSITSALSTGVESISKQFIDPAVDTIEKNKDSINNMLPDLSEGNFPSEVTDELKTNIISTIGTISQKVNDTLDEMTGELPTLTPKLTGVIDNKLNSLVKICVNIISNDIFRIMNTIPGFAIKEPINIIRRYIIYNFTYMIVTISICAFFTMVSLFFTLIFMCIRRPGLGKYTKHTGKSEFSSSEGTSYSTSNSSGRKKKKKHDSSYSESSDEGVVTVKFVTKKDTSKKGKKASSSGSSQSESSSSAGIAKNASGKNKNFASSDSSSSGSSSGSSENENGKSVYM